MGVSQMTGTPWHLETLKSNDYRRHKSNCGYYDNGYCKFYLEKCRGSAHCDHYDENAVCTIATATSKNHIEKYKIHKKEHKKLKDIYKPGDKVTNIFKAVNNKTYYKTGIIIDVDANGYIVVEFTSKKGSHYNETFHYPECSQYLKPFRR